MPEIRIIIEEKYCHNKDCLKKLELDSLAWWDEIFDFVYCSKKCRKKEFRTENKSKWIGTATKDRSVLA